MFENLFNKVGTFGVQHQLLFALIVALSIICVSWGIEKILEHHVFPQKNLRDCLLVVILGLTLLWITQHYILHAI